MKDKRAFVFPNALLVFLFSLTMFRNDVELGESGMMESMLAFFMAFIPLLVIVSVTSLFKKDNRTV
ncbi:hypothetical protein [Pseudalkalibacillus sp. R45]|uniref:hypothetical protein n=1 Tax=Pseudalkalibacillus sp. R45 TaxID=3457433 RepID=UPI003FCD0F01